MSLYKRNNSTIWWTKFKHRGEIIRRSTNTTDRKAAETEARRVRVEVEQTKGPGGGSAGVTLAVLEELHTQALKNEGFGEQRLTTIAILWRNLQKHLGGEHRDATTITAREVNEYQGARRTENHHGEAIRGQTIRRELQALRKGFTLAKVDKLIDAAPFDWDVLSSVKSDTPRKSKKGKARTDATINAVLAALSPKAKRAGHDKMLRFIRLTGLRLEEFRRFQSSWLHPAPRGFKSAALLVIPAGSSKTETGARMLPLNDEALMIAKEWGSKFARKNFNHSLRLASVAAGVTPRLTPRDLRATYITNVARKDITAAQKLAGHTNIATTGLYVDLDAVEAMRVGVLALPAARRGHSGGAQRNDKKRKA